jgi:hypothetical protein
MESRVNGVVICSWGTPIRKSYSGNDSRLEAPPLEFQEDITGGSFKYETWESARYYQSKDGQDMPTGFG